MSRPSILFVLNSLDTGGSEAKIVRVVNELVHSDVGVELAYLNSPETLLSRIDQAVSVSKLGRRGKYSIRALKRLSRILERGHTAVVAVNLYPLLYVMPAVKAQQSGKVKCIGLVNTAALVGKARLGGPLYGLLLRQCDQVIFGCNSQRRSWIQKYGLSDERAGVIYNGVDNKYYSPNDFTRDGKRLLEQHKVPEGAFIFGSIGRLAPEKSFDLLIRAVARLNASGRDAYLLLAGKGCEKSKLEHLAVSKGVSDRVKFIGLQADVRPVLSVLDVFALPSTAIETFSNAALEAMSMARPVVLSDMGGASEMVEHGANGMVVPVGDVDALTTTLMDLYDSSDLRRQLGAAARQRVVTAFAFEKMVEEYRRLAG